MAHRLTGQGAERVLILLKKFPSGGGDPLIELGSVPDREACQESGNLGGERAFRLLRNKRPEVTDLTLNRLGQLDDGTIAAKDVP